jgi:hypothetical protein
MNLFEKALRKDLGMGLEALLQDPDLLDRTNARLFFREKIVRENMDYIRSEIGSKIDFSRGKVKIFVLYSFVPILRGRRVDKSLGYHLLLREEFKKKKFGKFEASVEALPGFWVNSTQELFVEVPLEDGSRYAFFEARLCNGSKARVIQLLKLPLRDRRKKRKVANFRGALLTALPMPELEDRYEIAKTYLIKGRKIEIGGREVNEIHRLHDYLVMDATKNPGRCEVFYIDKGRVERLSNKEFIRICLGWRMSSLKRGGKVIERELKRMLRGIWDVAVKDGKRIARIRTSHGSYDIPSQQIYSFLRRRFPRHYRDYKERIDSIAIAKGLERAKQRRPGIYA